VKLLARAWPVEDSAALNEHDIGGPLDAFPLAFRWWTERRSNVSSSSAPMARQESTPVRPIVSKSGSAAGELAALTGSPVECTGMWKDAQASPSPQARDANNAFQDTPAASAFKTVGVERISGKARLGGPLFVSYGLVESGHARRESFCLCSYACTPR
jgi:hypothetical protein